MTEIYTLSLHDALPIYLGIQAVQVAVLLDHQRVDLEQGQVVVLEQLGEANEDVGELLDLVTLQAQLEGQRSEEHTSELQSRENLVCRLLLEKKKHTNRL